MHPELGLFSRVVQTFIARGPSAEGFVAVFSLAAPPERHMLCTCARMLLSHRTRLEYVLAAARRDDFALSDAEILLGPGYEEIAAQVRCCLLRGRCLGQTQRQGVAGPSLGLLGGTFSAFCTG